MTTQQQNKKRSLILSKYIYLVLFLIGAIAFLYPLITGMINLQTQSRVISNYREEVAQYSEEEKQKISDEAEEYNKFVAGLEGNVTDEVTDREKETSNVVYMNVLATGEAIGFLEIPKIDIELPIFHGAHDDVLERGVGHLERSSFPIGGENTHSVLVAHRGLPTSRLFRDLDKLEEGDFFFVSTLDEKIAYEVESIQVVLPHETELLRVREGSDLVTLVTCEPYMINSHRLLVTAHRTDYFPQLEEQAKVNKISFFEEYIEYFVIAGSFALVFFSAWIVRRGLRKKRSEGLELKVSAEEESCA